MLRIQELEARVESLTMGDDERNAKLVAENNAIRTAWVQARQQAANLEMMLQNLKQTLEVGFGLGDDASGALERSPGSSTTVRDVFKHVRMLCLCWLSFFSSQLQSRSASASQ
jgi:hypothetical protein